MSFHFIRVKYLQHARRHVEPKKIMEEYKNKEENNEGSIFLSNNIFSQGEAIDFLFRNFFLVVNICGVCNTGILLLEL